MSQPNNVLFNSFYPRHGYIRTVTVPKLQTLLLRLNAHTVKLVSCTHFLYFRTTQSTQSFCVRLGRFSPSFCHMK